MFPSVTISFNLKPGVALGDAVAAIQKIEKRRRQAGVAGDLVPGQRAGLPVLAEGHAATDRAALVVIYIILGVLYESLIHPITILSTLPSAGIGALLLLMAVHMDLSVIAHHRHHPADRHRQEERHHAGRFRARGASGSEGLSPEEAIHQACTLRFRPILMTTMAALLGGVPLMLGTGTGSEFRQPLGYTIVGGLLLSQILTLYTTPVVYLYLDRLGAWFSRPKPPAPTWPARSRPK